MEDSSTGNLPDTVSMKLRSRKLFVLTIVLATSFVLLTTCLSVGYVQVKKRATARCLELATYSLQVELDLFKLNWRCVLTDTNGEVTERRVSLY